MKTVMSSKNERKPLLIDSVILGGRSAKGSGERPRNAGRKRLLAKGDTTKRMKM